MSMTTCRDCGVEMSTSARACPRCGAVVKRTKWWLWVPLGAGALFLAYGLTVSKQEGRALEARRVCERELMPRGMATQYDCDKAFNEAMSTKRKDGCPAEHPNCSWGR